MAVESTTALRVVDLILARIKCPTYSWSYMDSMFVNAPKIQNLFLMWDNDIQKNKTY